MSRRKYTVIYSEKLSKPNEPRFVVVHSKTRELLDDANGQGYKTKRDAYVGYRKNHKKYNQNHQKKYVYVEKDGELKTCLYKDIIEHENDIIEDNVAFGIRHAEYSEEETEEYWKEATKELSELKRLLREMPSVILQLDRRTERYIPIKNEDGSYKTGPDMVVPGK